VKLLLVEAVVLTSVVSVLVVLPYVIACVVVFVVNCDATIVEFTLVPLTVTFVVEVFDVVGLVVEFEDEVTVLSD